MVVTVRWLKRYLKLERYRWSIPWRVHWRFLENVQRRRQPPWCHIHGYYMKNDNGTLSEFGCVMKKRIGTINSNDNRIYISDIPVYRYADALLMMAEIENGLNNPCASYINEVRKRAYGDTFEENKYTEGSYAENELAILQERDKSLSVKASAGLTYCVCTMHPDVLWSFLPMPTIRAQILSSVQKKHIKCFGRLISVLWMWIRY